MWVGVGEIECGCCGLVFVVLTGCGLCHVGSGYVV